MAARPWVTPEEVKAYSEYKTVQGRAAAKLEVDIARAEQYVINFANNPFGDGYASVPSPVKTAVILIAESYAHNAVEATKELKSETYDDYSYTAESTVVDVNSLDIGSLLEGYVIAQATGTVTMRMRRL